MPNDLVCDACGLSPQAREATPDADNGLQPGWVRRKIGKRTFTLCEVCGSIHQFKGGISAYLQDALGVGPNAVCDFSKSEPGSGLHRLRRRSDRAIDDGSEGGQ